MAEQNIFGPPVIDDEEEVFTRSMFANNQMPKNLPGHLLKTPEKPADLAPLDLSSLLGFANLGGQLASMTGQGLGQLFSAGQMQQTYDQSLLDEDFRYKTALQNEPMTRLSWIQDMLSGVPSSGQKITQQPIPYTNPIVGAVGAGIAGMGAYKGLT